jgi:hypothetical protein
MRVLLGFIVLCCLASSASIERGSLPDQKLTPGDTLGVTKADIRTPGYTKVVRAVPIAVKRQVYAAYGRSRRKGVCCEVDHLISLEREARTVSGTFGLSHMTSSGTRM